MKYIVLLGDGMSDYPVPELDMKTPLEAARTPSFDFIASNGIMGMVKTLPDGFPLGSDVANLSVMGYDPKKYYTGRSPLEAVSMGLKLSDTDTALRCNLVTLSDDENYENKRMIDYSSDEISTEEAEELINTLKESFDNDEFILYSGISYRHCLIWDNGPLDLKLTPPHDILEKRINNYLPSIENCGVLLDIMKRSYNLLKDHPINTDRISRGLRPANSVWLWGEGRKPTLDSFKDKFGIKGAVISAVDLLKGIGICAGLESIDVEGVTGNIHTNFKGKANAALKALENGTDFVYIHVEAPDECGHRYEIENKVKAIELIDSEVLSPLLEGLKVIDDYRILMLPDHPTPLSLRTHTSEPVPFVLYDSTKDIKSDFERYSEKNASETGLYIDEGYKLIEKLIKER